MAEGGGVNVLLFIFKKGALNIFTDEPFQISNYQYFLFSWNTDNSSWSFTCVYRWHNQPIVAQSQPTGLEPDTNICVAVLVPDCHPPDHNKILLHRSFLLAWGLCIYNVSTYNNKSKYSMLIISPNFNHSFTLLPLISFHDNKLFSQITFHMFCHNDLFKFYLFFNYSPLSFYINMNWKWYDYGSFLIINFCAT